MSSKISVVTSYYYYKIQALLVLFILTVSWTSVESKSFTQSQILSQTLAESSSSDLDGTAHVCVWVEGDGTRSKWCLETLKVIGSEAAALRKKKKKCYHCPVSNSINKNVSCRWKKKKVSVDGNRTRQQFWDSGSQLLWLSQWRRCRAIFPSLSGWARCDRLSARTSSNQSGKFHPGATRAPRRWQALIMAAAAGGGRLEVRRAVFLRATPAFCASLRIVPYALSE